MKKSHGYICISCGRYTLNLLLHSNKWKICPNCGTILLNVTWEHHRVQPCPVRLQDIYDDMIKRLPELKRLNIFYTPNIVGGFVYDKSRRSICIGDISFLNADEIKWLIAHTVINMLLVNERETTKLMNKIEFGRGNSARSKILDEAYRRGLLCPCE